MATTAKQDQPSAVTPSCVPPLENGDRLTWPEFEKRYAAMPELKKAELIEGVVYVPSPVSDEHATTHLRAGFWLACYQMATPVVVCADNGTVRLDLENSPQPDLHVRLLPEYGGQSHRDASGYIIGAPELVVEIAGKSISYDLHDKMSAYCRHGVHEYIVWKLHDAVIEWFVLRERQFAPLAIGEDGLYRSEVFPGLWLDPAALIRGDLATVAQIAQRGVASPEHAQFLERLSHKHEGPAAR